MENISFEKISFEKISFEKISYEKISFEKISFEKNSSQKISFEQISSEKIFSKKSSILLKSRRFLLKSKFHEYFLALITFFFNIFRLNTRPKDTSLGGYFTQSQQGSPIRRVYENNMDEFSFNTVDESIMKTINSTHQAYFDLVSTIEENVKYGCKV